MRFDTVRDTLLLSRNSKYSSAIAFFFVAMAARLVFFYATRYLIDDAYITYRYSLNFSHGLGFSFDRALQTYGFTSPLWMAWCALGAKLGITIDAWGSASGMIADAIMCAICWHSIKNFYGKIFISCYLLLNPLLARTAVSGMETSLFCLLMVLWALRTRPRLAASIAPLVRPEGWLISLWEWRGKKDNLLVLVPGLAWIAFSWIWFGSPIPTSASVKTWAYGGFTPALLYYWSTYFLFVPSVSVQPPMLCLGMASMLPLVLSMLFSKSVKRASLVICAIMVVSYIASGVPACMWYVSPILVLIALEAANNITKPLVPSAMMACAILVAMLPWTVLTARTESETVMISWGNVATIMSKVPASWSILTEPAGLVSVFTGSTLYDEVGLVTPSLAQEHRKGPGWYERAIRRLRPELLAVRSMYYEKNIPISGTDAPFYSDQGWSELNQYYSGVVSFQDTMTTMSAQNSKVMLMVRKDKYQELVPILTGIYGGK